MPPSRVIGRQRVDGWPSGGFIILCLCSLVFSCNVFFIIYSRNCNLFGYFWSKLYDDDF